MTRQQLQLHFDADESLYRRIGKGDVYAPTKEKPVSKLKPQRVKFQLSVFRRSMTTDDDVCASDPYRDGIAKATASTIFAIAASSVRVVCADDPTDGLCGDAHALIAVVATGTNGVVDYDESSARAAIVDAFAVHRPPTK